MNRDLLQERARSLARRRLKETTDPDLPYLAFRLVGEQYALPLSQLTGVIKVEKVTPVPAAHKILLGFTNTRGIVLPIYSLARLLGLEAGEVQHPIYALLANFHGLSLGLRVDETVGLIAVTDQRLQTPGDYTKGRTRDGVVILDTQLLWEHPFFQEQAN